MSKSKYERIADHIRSQIASGQLRPGDQLPTNKQLQEQFGASSNTVQSSFLVLKCEGFIGGPGLFVAAGSLNEPSAPDSVTPTERG